MRRNILPIIIFFGRVGEEDGGGRGITVRKGEGLQDGFYCLRRSGSLRLSKGRVGKGLYYGFMRNKDRNDEDISTEMERF